MNIDADGFLQLTYCTNIHPADGWNAVQANLARVAPALRQQLSPSGRFGVGLRLSAREARELLTGGRLDAFRAFLDEHRLYVAIINGFPYGHFHGTPVKAEVYAPDWRDDARVAYTLDLVESCGLTYLHVFPFSPREGTPAARMPQVDRRVAKERAARLRERGEAAHTRYLDRLEGQRIEFLLESEHTGRTPQFAEMAKAQGFESDYADVSAWTAAVPAERKKWQDLIRISGAKNE